MSGESSATWQRHVVGHLGELLAIRIATFKLDTVASLYVTMWSMSFVIPFILVLQALSQSITVNTTSGQLLGIKADGGEFCLDCYLSSVFLAYI
jgi:hypothetical protein